MSKHVYSYLALGDSYTIGESVPLHESFPYQLVQLLRKNGIPFHAPEIIAKTGWTSFELAEHLLHTQLPEHFDFVTLLIGVNNQYRGLALEDFTTDMDFLVKKAIHLANQQAEKVLVLSIPDWGATPFAKERDTATISKEIDTFNEVCKAAADRYGCHFIEITEDSRVAAKDVTLLATDQLHYAVGTHAKWAEKVFREIQKMV